MNTTFAAPQDNPETTEKEAKRHRQELSSSNSYGHLNPSITDPATELTEDDIFRMKKLRLADYGAGTENQSAVSVVDSASNFGENTVEADDENDNDIPYDEEDDLDELNESNKSRNGPAHALELHKKTHSLSQVVVCGDYVFGRVRPEHPLLNADTVTVLNFPFQPLAVPRGEDVNEYRKCFSDAKVFLVGTAHFSQESQQDVLKTILNTQPDVIMVELCSSRISILSMDEQSLLREAKNLNREKMMAVIKESGLVQGILHVLLLSISAHITRQLGMAPGGEFRAAHNGSLQITLQRALGSLGVFQKLRLFFHILLSNRTAITQEDVERCKNKDLLEELLKEMAGEFPQLTKIFVDERDQYMTHMLHNLLQSTSAEKWNASRQAKVKYEPVNIVAVVGIGHVAGIVAAWNQHIDSSDLLTIPQPTKKAKAMKFVFKAVSYGV
uniref:TraB domain-containing protein n=1 Tax=Ditylenchus dipsaci TaxID=166011 RepID=A0A915ED55_9BILA